MSTTTPAKPPRTRRSREEAAALVADWQASGLNKAAFCRDRGILRSTLSSCLARISPVAASAPRGFVEVRPVGTRPAAGLTLEVDGCLLSGLDAATAAVVIAALRAAGR